MEVPLLPTLDQHVSQLVWVDERLRGKVKGGRPKGQSLTHHVLSLARETEDEEGRESVEEVGGERSAVAALDTGQDGSPRLHDPLLEVKRSLVRGFVVHCRRLSLTARSES